VLASEKLLGLDRLGEGLGDDLSDLEVWSGWGDVLGPFWEPFVGIILGVMHGQAFSRPQKSSVLAAEADDMRV
jgi:hypothetical protein